MLILLENLQIKMVDGVQNHLQADFHPSCAVPWNELKEQSFLLDVEEMP